MTVPNPSAEARILTIASAREHVMFNPSNPYGSRGSVMDLLAGGPKQHQFVVSRRRTRFGDCLWSPASAWCYA
ncbi:hypothetical protein MESS4_330101 [Mesorhizobium sp. STM 4661]|nr:hypothetical protein MESS4_330101 [Mesorhizobium sp. STM 4661]